MGFTFNGRHSDDFSLCVQTKGMPVIPPKRQQVEAIQGRDGQHVFEDGYDNIQIKLSCIIAGDVIYERRKKAREIAVWLSSTGILVFDYESDVEYEVIRITNNIDEEIVGREYYDNFEIVFECEPSQKQTFYNDNLTWEEGETPWNYLGIPWEGYPRSFAPTDGQVIEVVNAGTYKALPIILLTGEAISVTVGPFTFKNLYGTIYIDCKNQVVYRLNGSVKENRILDFSGDFPELLPGTNRFLVSGSFIGLGIEFDYKNTYL